MVLKHLHVSSIQFRKDAERYTQEAEDKKEIARAKMAEAQGVQVDSPVRTAKALPVADPREAGALKLEAEAQAFLDEADTYRVNPNRYNGKPQTAEWTPGTPEFLAREKKIRELIGKYDSKRRDAKMLRTHQAPRP